MLRAISAPAAALTLIATFLTSAALHAQEPERSHGKEGPMMGPGMMNMMPKGSGMMNHCSNMMQGTAGRPNDQWRNGGPPANGQNEKKD